MVDLHPPQSIMVDCYPSLKVVDSYPLLIMADSRLPQSILVDSCPPQLWWSLIHLNHYDGFSPTLIYFKGLQWMVPEFIPPHLGISFAC